MLFQVKEFWNDNLLMLLVIIKVVSILICRIDVHMAKAEKGRWSKWPERRSDQSKKNEGGRMDYPGWFSPDDLLVDLITLEGRSMLFTNNELAAGTDT